MLTVNLFNVFHWYFFNLLVYVHSVKQDLLSEMLSRETHADYGC